MKIAMHSTVIKVKVLWHNNNNRGYRDE